MYRITDFAEASIQFNGTPINEIPNIVKAMTGQSTLQIGKESLMFLERVPVFNKGHTDANYSDNSYVQARIFSLNEDGSLAKTFTFNPIDNTGLMFIGSDWDIKATRPVISNQASSSGYLAMFQGANGRNSTSVSANFPVQTLNRSGAGTDSSFNPQTVTELSKSGWTNLYGNGALTLPTYDGEVFASAHSIGKTSLKKGSPVTLTLSFMKYNHERKPEHDTEKDLSLYTVTDEGLYHASIAVGDFDNDGYKNDVSILVFTKNKIRLYIYTVTYDSTKGNAALVKRYEKLVRNTKDYGTDKQHYPSGNVFCGDFYGDGDTEVAIMIQADMNGTHFLTTHSVYLYKWDNDKKAFGELKLSRNEQTLMYWGSLGRYGDVGIQVLAADLNGDGADELVCCGLAYGDANHTTIIPTFNIFDFTTDDGYGYEGYFSGGWPIFNFGNYYTDEAFSVAAGAFTGRYGKTKTVDDIAFSFTDTSKKVYILPSPVDENGNYKTTGYNNYFKDVPQPILIYDSSEIDSSMSGKYNSAGKFYGGLLAADFLSEGIELANPQQLVDIQDPTYAVILPAFPYHVDNINERGTALIDHPNNFSFSGFDDGDNGGGKMSLTYRKSTTSSSSSSMTFSSTATEDTFFTNNDSPVLKVANDYLQFKRMSSHMLADFGGDSKAGKIGSIAAKVYDFFNNHTEAVTTKMNEESTVITMEDNFTAAEKDAVLLFDAKTYIWRYKVLSNYLPLWLTSGGVIDSINDNSVNIPDSADREYFITFSMQDDIIQSNRKVNVYQPRHEEGNLFSYPAKLDENEGYNPAGNLMNGTAREFFVPDGNASGFGLKFSNTKSTGNHYKQDDTPSEASKTLSFFKSAWNDVKNLFTGGNSTVDSTPDQTEHSQNFTKSYATDESIYVESKFRTTLQGQTQKTSLAYTVGLMPYLSKQGTMRVASYVHLETDPTENYYLFNPDSLYVRSADPALLLPEKFTTDGSKFVAQTNHIHAMKMRGVRFYSKEYGGYSNSLLIPGLTYIIEVPVYNASFKKAENVTVRLSYSKTLNPQVKQDTATRTVIQEKTITLMGWDNLVNSVKDGTSNRGVVKFEWKIPESITDGNYYFYVDIDPNNAIKEVHESRMKSPTEVADCGGNNEGFFPFSVLHLTEANAKKIIGASSAAPTGVLYASSMNGAVRASSKVEQVPSLNTKVHFNGSENIDAVYEYLRQAKITSPDTDVVIDCEVENVTAVIFPEAILYGLNIKPGEEYYRNNSDGAIEFNYAAFSNAFVRHDMMLFPNDTTRFTFSVRPADIDFDNGAVFALIIPNMPITNSGNGEDNYPDPVIDDTPSENPDDDSTESNYHGSSSGGCDMGFGSMVMISLAGLYVFMKR